MDSSYSTLEKLDTPRVQHFSVFAENRAGALLDLVKLLNHEHIEVVALSVQDSTDSSIVRIIVSDPDRVKELFAQQGIAHSHTEVVVVEMVEASDLGRLLATLLQAEVNIHYSYPVMTRPHGRCALVIHPDDDDCAIAVLSGAGFKILNQGDISR